MKRSWGRIVGQLVRKCIDEKRTLAAITVEELRVFDGRFDEGYEEIVDLERSLERKLSYGSTSPEQVSSQLAAAGMRLQKLDNL